MPTDDGGFHKANPNDPIAKAETFRDLSQWFAFDTNCEYLGYDQVAKDYFKEFTININAITVPELHHDVDSYEKIISSDSIQADRLRSMVSKNLLKKRFDYTFTGLNTEVIDLDISLSTTYYQIQALNLSLIHI